MAWTLASASDAVVALLDAQPATASFSVAQLNRAFKEEHGEFVHKLGVVTEVSGLLERLTQAKRIRCLGPNSWRSLGSSSSSRPPAPASSGPPRVSESVPGAASTASSSTSASPAQRQSPLPDGPGSVAGGSVAGCDAGSQGSLSRSSSQLSVRSSASSAGLRCKFCQHAHEAAACPLALCANCGLRGQGHDELSCRRHCCFCKRPGHVGRLCPVALPCPKFAEKGHHTKLCLTTHPRPKVAPPVPAVPLPAEPVSTPVQDAPTPPPPSQAPETESAGSSGTSKPESPSAERPFPSKVYDRELMMTLRAAQTGPLPAGANLDEQCRELYEAPKKPFNAHVKPFEKPPKKPKLKTKMFLIPCRDCGEFTHDVCVCPYRFCTNCFRMGDGHGPSGCRESCLTCGRRGHSAKQHPKWLKDQPLITLIADGDEGCVEWPLEVQDHPLREASPPKDGADDEAEAQSSSAKAAGPSAAQLPVESSSDTAEAGPWPGPGPVEAEWSAVAADASERRPSTVEVAEKALPAPPSHAPSTLSRRIGSAFGNITAGFFGKK